MGVRNTNTTVYHPQMHGLLGKLNRTLTNMLAKTVQKDDMKLPYIPFAYRSNPQETTQESLFFLYGQ